MTGRGPSLTTEAVNGIVWQSLSIGANLVLRFVVIIILTRSLSPRDFGIVAAATVVISIASVFSEIGVGRVLVQRPSLPDAIQKSAFAISLYAGLLASVLIFAGASLVSALFRMDGLAPFVQVLSVTLLLNTVSAVPEALAQRERRFRAMGLIELTSFLFGFGAVALPMASAGFGAWSLVTAYVVQSLLKLIAYWLVCRPRVSFLPGEGTRELLFTGASFMSGQLGNFMARQLDYLVVGRFLGPVALGYYNRAYQFLMFPAQLFGNSILKVLFPSISAIQDDTTRVARAFRRAIGVIAMLTLPLTAFLIIVAPELIVFLLGREWIPMIVPFQILIASLLFRTSYKVSDSVCLALGSLASRAWRQWLYALAVALGAGIGTLWGPAGVAAGVGLAVVFNYVLMLDLAGRLIEVSMKEMVRLHARQFFIAVAFGVPVYGAVAMARQYGFGNLGVVVIGTGAAAIAMAVLWFGFRRIFGKDGEWLAEQMHDRLRAVTGRRGEERKTPQP